jgi:Cu(I)/Ag(I) efflux system membrane fusion protein
MVGKVDYDESRIRTITAWVPGRIDRLYADTVGIRIQKGEHLAELYSPELISAQAEFLQALQTARQAGNTAGVFSQSARGVADSAREKLRLLGLLPEQIRAIEESGQIRDHLTLYSPLGGLVIEKYAQEGIYVQTGQPIYKVADLSRVWIRLDAYESDLPWVQYGQPVEFSAAAYPGKTFRGTVSFVDPFLNPKTRTVKLRVIAENPDGLLKPEMFVQAVLRVRPDAHGRTAIPEMAGKWLCPMHPDILRESADTCPVCGMPLVTAENLGIRTHTSGVPPLVIPASSVLWTGKRSVVYVRLADRVVPTFEGREITVGSRAGEYYLVEAGLEEGQEVVSRGAYRIDADLQIQAKASMMNPKEFGSPSGASGHSGHSM